MRPFDSVPSDVLDTAKAKLSAENLNNAGPLALAGIEMSLSNTGARSDVLLERPVGGFEYSNVISVGIDLVMVSDVRRSLSHFGQRYLQRLFSSREISDCLSDADPAPRLAARFAAKEATIKALKVEGHQPAWTSMEVWRHPAGWPDQMRLTGWAAHIASERGIGKLNLSLGHEADAAIAIVVATKATRHLHDDSDREVT